MKKNFIIIVAVVIAILIFIAAGPLTHKEKHKTPQQLAGVPDYCDIPGKHSIENFQLCDFANVTCTIKCPGKQTETGVMLYGNYTNVFLNCDAEILKPGCTTFCEKPQVIGWICEYPEKGEQ